MSSTARMVPLVARSTGRNLVLRPRTSTPASFLASPFSASHTCTAPARRPIGLLGARGFADNVTWGTRPPPGAPLPPTPAASEAPSQPADGSADALLSTGGPTPAENAEALRQLELMAQGAAPFDADEVGHNFGLTTATTRAALAGDSGANDIEALPFPLTPALRERYDPMIAQLTRLMMKDGKLAKAQRDMSMVLNNLRMSPPPTLNPARPLTRGHLPASQLPLEPEYYLSLVVDSVAPLLKIRMIGGAAGGGRALPVPVPLAQRQRRRTAFMWLLDTVANKPSRGSGRGLFAARVADEVIAVAEGRSSLWDKRLAVHKLCTSARMNAGVTGKKKLFKAKYL